MANYEYTFKNFAGDLWNVQILDSLDIGADPYILHPLDNGFNLQWQGETEATYKPILTSSLNFDVYRDDNSLQLLQSLASSVMGRFEVVINKLTGAYEDELTPYWFGYVLQDSMQVDDLPNNVGKISFSASDGFGELQDIKFDDFDIALPNARRTLVEWLALICTKLPLTYKTTGGTIQTASVWYCTEHASTSADDPMNNTINNESVFVKVEDFINEAKETVQIVTGLSFYEILVTILESFNLVLKHWEGTYLLIQDNTMIQATTRSWLYDKTGTFVSTQLIDLQQTMPSRLAGGSFSKLAPIKKVSTEYDYKNGIYTSNFLPTPTAESTVYNLGSFEEDVALTIGGFIPAVATVPAGDSSLDLEYTITITRGSYYLQKITSAYVPEGYMWTLTPSSVLVYATERLFTDNPTEFDAQVDTYFNFILFGIVGVNDDITFEYSLTNIISSEITVVVVGGGQITASIVNSGLNPDMEGTVVYDAGIADDIKYTLELNKSIIGDGPYSLSAGSIKVVDANTDIVKSEKWCIYSEIPSAGMALHSLRCREMLALRRVTTSFMHGTFSGTPNPFKGFEYNAEIYTITQINWEANKNEYSFTAIALVYGS